MTFHAGSFFVVPVMSTGCGSVGAQLFGVNLFAGKPEAVGQIYLEGAFSLPVGTLRV